MEKTQFGQLVLASNVEGMVTRVCGLLTSLGMDGSMAGSFNNPSTFAISPMDLPSNIVFGFPTQIMVGIDVFNELGVVDWCGEWVLGQDKDRCCCQQ